MAADGSKAYLKDFRTACNGYVKGTLLSGICGRILTHGFPDGYSKSSGSRSGDRRANRDRQFRRMGDGQFGGMEQLTASRAIKVWEVRDAVTGEVAQRIVLDGFGRKPEWLPDSSGFDLNFNEGWEIIRVHLPPVMDGREHPIALCSVTTWKEEWGPYPDDDGRLEVSDDRKTALRAEPDYGPQGLTGAGQSLSPENGWTEPASINRRETALYRWEAERDTLSGG